MDDLLEKIGGTWRVSTEESSSISAPHPRFSYYKYKFSASSQEERRTRFIEAQKQKRYDFVQHARCLAEGQWDASSDADEDMDVTPVHKRPERSYKNQLMLSEWLVDVPRDIEDNWIVVPCPVGKRCLVVASKGRTKAYARNGYKVASFPSLLPGGCRENNEKYSEYCLLDCVQGVVDSTFYVLDIMCWRSHPVFDSEAEFRFYWLQTKLAEAPNIGEQSEQNRYKFVTLTRCPFTKESVGKMLNSPLPFPDKLDGLLFYHKQAHYQPGTVTPLVGWLKAFMVPEILGIDVDEAYFQEKPSSYTSLQEKVANKGKDKQTKRAEKPEKMETEGAGRGRNKRKEKVEKMEEDNILKGGGDGHT